MDSGEPELGLDHAYQRRDRSFDPLQRRYLAEVGGVLANSVKTPLFGAVCDLESPQVSTLAHEWLVSAHTRRFEDPTVIGPARLRSVVGEGDPVAIGPLGDRGQEAFCARLGRPKPRAVSTV